MIFSILIQFIGVQSFIFLNIQTLPNMSKMDTLCLYKWKKKAQGHFLLTRYSTVLRSFIFLPPFLPFLSGTSQNRLVNSLSVSYLFVSPNWPILFLPAGFLNNLLKKKQSILIHDFFIFFLKR